MSQSIKATRAALFALCQELYADAKDSRGSAVHVVYGPPGDLQPDYIVAVMGTRQPITEPTMGGPTRSREAIASIEISFSCYVSGAEVAQQVASEACDDLVRELESYFQGRTGQTETLGGACRNALVSNVEGPVPALARHPKSGAVTGRVAEAVVTVSAAIRY